MGPFLEPFRDSALHLARFSAHAALIAAMRAVISGLSGDAGLGWGLEILDVAESAAIAVAAIRSFGPLGGAWKDAARSALGGAARRRMRSAGFLSRDF